MTTTDHWSSPSRRARRKPQAQLRRKLGQQARRGSLALLLLATAFPQAAWPGGDHIRVRNVAHGRATFEWDGGDATIRVSDDAIINYLRFDIPGGAKVRFVQPSRHSRVLNRILSASPSRIDGGLYANGIVYLVNPAGITFGPHAVVDVARLYAVAGQMTDADFLNHVDRFVASHGTVHNQGTIRTLDGAHLIGRQVINSGTIVAERGVVTLTSGEEVYLAEEGSRLMVRVDHPDAPAQRGEVAPEGVVNEGTVQGEEVFFSSGDVYSLALVNRGQISAPGGKVALRGSGLVANEGTIDVSEPSPGGTGGTIELSGSLVANTGTIDASGDAGGGSILVGGDYRGAGPLPLASYTFVGPEAVLRADSLSRGDGGKVIVWADETTRFLGRIEARGGTMGGDGGFAEVSGKDSLCFRGTADLSAPAGAHGSLLLDPASLIIAGGTADGAADGTDTFAGDPSGLAGTVLFADGAPATIYESELEGLDADIVLEATQTITTSGDFTDDAVTLASDRSLTLRTRNQAGDGAGGIDLTASLDGDALLFRTQGSGSITIDASTSGEALGDAALGKLTTDDGAIHVATGNGTITLHNDVETAGGDITLDGPVDLAANLSLSSGAAAGGHIRLTSTLDGNAQLTFDAGSGTVRCDGAVGGATPLAAFDVTSAANVDLNASLTAGTLSIVSTLAAEGDLLANSGDLTLGDALTLDGAMAQRLDAQAGTLTAASSLTKTGAGQLTLGGATAIDLDGTVDVDAGSLVIEDAFAAAADLLASNDLTLQGPGTLDGAGNQRLDAEGGTLHALDTLNKPTTGFLTLAGSGGVDLDDTVDVDQGGLIIEDPFTASGDLLARGDVSLQAAGTFDGTIAQRVDSEDGGSIPPSRALTSLGPLTKTGLGDLTLAGATAIDLDGTV
ncbi:MAG: filamentous hemagglutinin N-terminal domain-containing protein, partial [bacterium]